MQIKFEKVTYIYQRKTPSETIAVKDVNLSIKPNKITAIIGGTGSGKSTLVQMINCLIKPSGGKIYLDNKWIITNSRHKIKNVKELRKKVGLVFQFAEYQLFEDTVKKDIIFGPKNYKEKDVKILDEIARKCINLVDLPEEFLTHSPFELSGGQKRRVAIAGILALEPDVLILDEPTAGLDPEGERIILDLIKKLNRKFNKTIILVTHNMNHVAEIADDVVVMKQGEVIAQDNPHTIFTNEKLINDNSLITPYVYDLVNKLAKKGIILNRGINTISDFVEFINHKKYNIKYTKESKGVNHK